MDVLVFFTNDWSRKQNASKMGWALADFVRSNYPSDGTAVVLNETIPDGFALVRIACVEGGWSTGSVGNTEFLRYEQLASRIVAKNRLVSEYRARMPEDWQVWLVFATHVSLLWSVSLPADVATWRFTCAFDRVLLSSWDYGVLAFDTVRDI